MSIEKDSKLKSLQATIANLDKTYGKGTVMKLGDRQAMDVESISTGSLGLDIALGVGGLPKGRVIEIYGPESSGKTTLAIHAIAEAQKQGGIAAFIDAEHAFDRSYAEALGVDVENLLISQPDFGEQAHEITENLIRPRRRAAGGQRLVARRAGRRSTDLPRRGRAAGVMYAGAFLGYPEGLAKPLIKVVEWALLPSLATTLALILVGPPEREPG